MRTVQGHIAVLARLVIGALPPELNNRQAAMTSGVGMAARRRMSRFPEGAMGTHPALRKHLGLQLRAVQAKSIPFVLQAPRSIAIWLMAMTALTATVFAQGQAIPIANANFDSVLLTCTPGPNCFEVGVLPGWAAGSPAYSFATFEPSTGPGGIFPGGIPGGGLERRK